MRWWDVERGARGWRRELFPDPWSVETFWSELALVPESRHYLVAEDRGEVVGYAGLVVVGHQADVQTLAVAPDAAGEGARARGCCDALLDEARRRDAGEVLLEVRADNEPRRRSTRGPGSSGSRSGAATTGREAPTPTCCGCAARRRGRPAAS